MLSKAELHVHLEGTAPPHLVRRIARRNGLDVPEGLFATRDRFAWRDFQSFLIIAVAGVIGRSRPPAAVGQPYMRE